MDAKRTTQKYYTDPAEAFAARTTQDSKGCLVWVGSRNKGGYGVMRVEGKAMYSHRYAYIREHGTIPEGMLIDHKCHNRACCEVTHLRAVTNKENLENRSGLGKSNTSGRRNVYWYKRLGVWYVQVVDQNKASAGGYYPPYELHVADYRARLLRDKLFTHHDSTGKLTVKA